jgi:hypothetical protein
MPKSDKPSAGRRPPPGASPIGAGVAHSGDATSVVTFSALSEAQWQAVHSTQNWPDGSDWRSMIEQAGRQVWEARAEREVWLEKIRGKPAAERKKKVEEVLRLTRQLQKAWADSSLDEADLPDPGLKLREQRAEVWLYHYGDHVSSFSNQRDPIQDGLEWELMSIWIEAGGELSFSRKKDDSTTPYRPLVNFLTLTLEAIIGKKYQPSGIADIIENHRPEIAKARGMRRRRRGGRFA